MKQRVRDLVGQGDVLFGQRAPVLSLWQSIAEQFYPTRADFTVTRSLGQEFADHLMTGAPALAHRELSDQFAAMLRPRGKSWFVPSVEDDALANDSVNKAWLEAKAATMRKVMYDRSAGFATATKEADRDFAAFGQAVMSLELNDLRNGLLYRTWHLRDCAWAENARRVIDTMHRKWQLSARGLMKLFPRTAAPEIRRLLEKEPHRNVAARHILIPADEYDFRDPNAARRAERFPFVSIYVDEENDTILEETPKKRSPYIVPRWQTVSGSPYAHSPATVIAIPDARLLQKITLTLLEAGEKAVNPPMIAQHEMLQGGVNVYAGGVTWVDADYDERTGEALKVLDTNLKGNLAFGADMAQRYEDLIKRAFYLDQIRLPPMDGAAMTATEIRTRTEEYIRAALPLFEPLEIEYNGALCEETFSLCLENGAFGNLSDMPPALAEQDIKWVFESPLQAAQSREKATAFTEASQLLGAAAQIDQRLVGEVDMRTAFRDALGGIVPAKWIVPDEVAKQALDAQAQAEEAQQAAAAVSAGAQVAGQVGDAATRLQTAGLVPQAGQLAPVAGAPV